LRCAIDVSDGLLQDLGHICQQSGLGATIARTTVPVDPALTGRYDEVEAMELALAGGEDYELLVTGLRDRIDAWAETIDVPVTVIGEMVPDDEHRVRLLDAAGQDITPGKTGWDHLRA
jgi:thiamine-monophosphate kinase